MFSNTRSPTTSGSWGSTNSTGEGFEGARFTSAINNLVSIQSGVTCSDHNTLDKRQELSPIHRKKICRFSLDDTFKRCKGFIQAIWQPVTPRDCEGTLLLGMRFDVLYDQILCLHAITAWQELVKHYYKREIAH